MWNCLLFFALRIRRYAKTPAFPFKLSVFIVTIYDPRMTHKDQQYFANCVLPSSGVLFVDTFNCNRSLLLAFAPIVLADCSRHHQTRVDERPAYSLKEQYNGVDTDSLNVALDWKGQTHLCFDPCWCEENKHMTLFSSTSLTLKKQQASHKVCATLQAFLFCEILVTAIHPQTLQLCIEASSTK